MSKLDSATPALAGAAAVVAQGVDIGVPLPDLLAAFAGASLILSFLKIPNVSNWRIAIQVAFCTGLGMLFGPTAAKYFGLAGLGVLGADFVVAAVGQIIVPLVIERRADFFNRVLPKGKP